MSWRGLLFGAWQKDVNENRYGEVSYRRENFLYRPPQDFQVNIGQYSDVPYGDNPKNETKCRLLSYDCKINGDSLPIQLSFTFSEIEYVDYLISGEHLDDFLPGDSTRTFRDKYAPRIDLDEIRNSPLTNICGLGIFIITRDNKIIVARRSANVRVWGNVWSYAASGTMSWKQKNLHPFDEVARECGHRILMGHEVRRLGNDHQAAIPAALPSPVITG